ncbi:MAG TPA: hypothetical protein PLN23_05845 [Fervidobacterium sp.]|nr:hypothetical protein [Fervidobacterium sp.]
MGDFEENFECVHNKTVGVGYEEKVIFVSFSLCGLTLYAAYASASLLGTTIAGYYETKYNQVSLDVYEKISLGKLSLESWGAIGAKTSDLLHFSYLVGGKAGYGNFDLSAQFLQLGANKFPNWRSK